MTLAPGERRRIDVVVRPISRVPVVRKEVVVETDEGAGGRQHVTLSVRFAPEAARRAGEGDG